MGIDEIIVAGENGLLIEAQSVSSICEKIQSVISNEDFAKKLGENGRKTALQYTWKASATELDKVYRSILK